MIASAALDAAAAQLDGAASSLDRVYSGYRAIHSGVSAGVDSLRSSWGGPLPEAMTAAAADYVAAVDATPVPMAGETVRRWSRTAREYAEEVRSVERRRTALAAELSMCNPWEFGLDEEIARRLHERRSQLSNELAATDGNLEELHTMWDRCCRMFAAELDTSAAVRAQAAVSAVARFAAAFGGSPAWLNATAITAWLATLSCS